VLQRLVDYNRSLGFQQENIQIFQTVLDVIKGVMLFELCVVQLVTAN